MHLFNIQDEPFARGYLSADTESLYIRTGTAFLQAAKEMELSLYEDLGLPNAAFRNNASGYAFSMGESVDLDLLRKKAEADPEYAEDYRCIADEMGKHNPMDLLQSAFTEREKAIICSFGGWGGTWGGHSVPNLIDFARYGTLKLREKVLHYKSVNTDAADFYDGILLLLDAVDVLGARFYDLAVRAAASCTDDHREKLERLAKTFARCPR